MQLTGEAPNSHVSRNRAHAARLLSRVLESPFGIVIRQHRQGSVGDLTGNATLGQELSDRPAPLTPAAHRRMDKLLGKVRVTEPPSADQLEDQHLCHDALHAVGDELVSGLSLRKAATPQAPNQSVQGSADNRCRLDLLRIAVAEQATVIVVVSFIVIPCRAPSLVRHRPFGVWAVIALTACSGEQRDDGSE